MASHHVKHPLQQRDPQHQQEHQKYRVEHVARTMVIWNMHQNIQKFQCYLQLDKSSKRKAGFRVVAREKGGQLRNRTQEMMR